MTEPTPRSRTMRRLLIANRGEIAARIARSASVLGVETVAISAAGDGGTLHGRHADVVRELSGTGVAAFLDIEEIVKIAVETECDALHPGYGFLSESAEMARQCRAAGVTFVGPEADTLEIFGDKTRARELAASCGVPVLPGTSAEVSIEEAMQLWRGLPSGWGVMVKALAGGGGRGTRAVLDPGGLEEAFERCRSEAQASFGDGRIYVEAMMVGARHIEVQIIGDGVGGVRVLGERDCSLQRRHQKLIEIAPAPGLSGPLRRRLYEYASDMAAAASYRGVGTFEFLVGPGPSGETDTIAFLETNPRLQVEHPVTEAVWGVDLVRIQLEIAAGATVDMLELPDVDPEAEPDAVAIEARVLAETMGEDGQPYPSGGQISRFELPGGPGVRTDHAVGVGTRPDPRFDSLLAKIVVYVPRADLATALKVLDRALGEVIIDGVDNNVDFLAAICGHADVRANRFTTVFVDENRSELLGQARDIAAARPATVGVGAVSSPTAAPQTFDPQTLDEGTIPVRAAMSSVVISVAVAVGDEVHAGQQVAVLEAMKMEHSVVAPESGIVRDLVASVGEVLESGSVIMLLEGATVGQAQVETAERDLDAVRPDLESVLERHAGTLDENRPEAVERRHRIARRTARENVADLVDDETFVEYGGLSIAAQRQRRTHEELVARTPADGMVGGIGDVDGRPCVVASYDYTVLAGTQGFHNHRKKDRLFDIAGRQGMPVVLFAEGGGGRPGDTDYAIASGLDVTTFTTLARLSGSVPLVGITGGRCFAGNAALLGTCDVIIATEDSNIGMGGPVMVEGGGLGQFSPEDIGPIGVQDANGVVDIRVRDDAEAVEVARRYLSYFTEGVQDWTAPDSRLARHVVPENRKQVYEVRDAIHALCDVDSVLELRAGFGHGMVTVLARVEGKAVGVVANNPQHLGGAIDTPAADKASRFMQLCDAFGLPLLFLCDTPGFMVGPDAETTATVRHFGRMFVTGANIDVPFGTIVLRKAYGLGSQAMAGGGFKAPLFTVAWPTGELGPMGLEGAVRLAMRREMEAIEDPTERQAFFDDAVQAMYATGSAMNVAEQFEIDDVIDPSHSRRWITTLLREPQSVGTRRPHIDTW